MNGEFLSKSIQKAQLGLRDIQTLFLNDEISWPVIPFLTQIVDFD